MNIAGLLWFDWYLRRVNGNEYQRYPKSICTLWHQWFLPISHEQRICSDESDMLFNYNFRAYEIQTTGTFVRL